MVRFWTEVHRMTKGSLAGVDLPEETKSVLENEGVPCELRLKDYLGPSLFTSQLQDARFKAPSDFPDVLQDRAFGDFYVFGGIQETQISSSTYSLFALRPKSGEVVLLDEDQDSYVNRSLGDFLSSLDFFAGAWLKWQELCAKPGDPETLKKFVEHTEETLHGLDETVLAGNESYWSQWVEQLSEEADE